MVAHGLLVVAGMLDCKLKPSIFQPVLDMRRRGRQPKEETAFLCKEFETPSRLPCCLGWLAGK
jgi:hypothetical protein